MEEKVAIEPTVSLDVAQHEFERFAECMDLDLDTKDMDDEDKTAFDKYKRCILTAIQRGNLVVNDNGEFIFTPVTLKDAPQITFFEPTGASFMTMDKKKRNHDVAKMHGIMADMTKQHAKLFAGMKMRDYRVCQAIVTLFLG